MDEKTRRLRMEVTFVPHGWQVDIEGCSEDKPFQEIASECRDFGDNYDTKKLAIDFTEKLMQFLENFRKEH